MLFTWHCQLDCFKWWSKDYCAAAFAGSNVHASPRNRQRKTCFTSVPPCTWVLSPSTLGHVMTCVRHQECWPGRDGFPHELAAGRACSWAWSDTLNENLQGYLHVPLVLHVPRSDMDACMKRSLVVVSNLHIGNAHRLMGSSAAVMIRTAGDDSTVLMLVALYTRAEASRLDICTLFSEARSNNSAAAVGAFKVWIYTCECVTIKKGCWRQV